MTATRAGSLVDADGRPLTLAVPLGRGGGGEVWTVRERPDETVKLITKPDQQTLDRLEAIFGMHYPERITNTPGLLAAWPRGWALDASGNPVGFLMRRAIGPAPYGFKQLSHWQERERIASNLAYTRVLAFAQGACSLTALAHGCGVVLADLNDRNYLAGGTGEVTLVDLDEAQFRDRRGTHWTTPRYTDEFLAPELLRADLRTVPRTQASDCYALAVLAFKLLFCGWHPYAGVWAGTGAPPALEEHAAAGRFPYPSTVDGLAPPPGAPSWRILTPRLASLFSQAFVLGAREPARRPSAVELADALGEAGRAMVRCRGPRQHFHPPGLASCPWCERERALGIAPPPRVRRPAAAPSAGRAATPPARAAQSPAAVPPPRSAAAPRRRSPTPASGGTPSRFWIVFAIAAVMIVLLLLALLIAPGGGKPASSGSASAESSAAASQDGGSATNEASSATPSGPSGPARVIAVHFHDLNTGDYVGAWRLFDAEYRRSVPGWIADRSAADPRIRLMSVDDVQYHGSGASVAIDMWARDTFATRGSDTLCRHFVGRVHLVHEGGLWRYDPLSNRLQVGVRSRVRRCPV